jgi:hypothetical protein
MVNLMTPWTIFWKELAGASAAHNIIDESQERGCAHPSRGRPDSAGKPIRDIYERLAQHGIDPAMAQLLAEHADRAGAGGLHLANVLSHGKGSKGHQARQALLAAVNGEVRRSIPTPSVLERPRIFDGTFYSAKGREEAQARAGRAAARYAAAPPTPTRRRQSARSSRRHGATSAALAASRCRSSRCRSSCTFSP